MEMQDGMKGNPEESLRRALAEFAIETGSGAASERVRQRLRREVRGRAQRRWALTALATAAALAAIGFGVTSRMSAPRPAPPPQTVAVGGNAASGSGSPAPIPAPVEVARAASPTAVDAHPASLGAAGLPATADIRIPAPRGPRSARRDMESKGDWRKGEVVLSPWYYNTALPPAARSVLVRSEVGARTAMRFGVVPVGETAPVEILFGEDGLPRAMRFVQRFPTQKN